MFGFKKNKIIVLLSALCSIALLAGVCVFFARVEDRTPPLWLLFSVCALSAAFIAAAHIKLIRSNALAERQMRAVLFSDDARHKEMSAQDIIQLLEEYKASAGREYAAEALRSRAEVSALQSQINPHFLYNTLDGIRSLALKSDARTVAEMTEALSSMFRYSISPHGDTVTLADELENVDSYLLIQQYRFPDKFSLSYELGEDEKKMLRCRMPRLTIQPVVENSIQHGLQNKRGKGAIAISGFLTQNRLVLRISDDGDGMTQETLDALNAKLQLDNNAEASAVSARKTGIALANVNRRIKLQCGPQYGLFVSSEYGVGTAVDIQLPFHPI